MGERCHILESLSEGVTEAKGEERRCNTFWLNARWSAIKVKNVLRVGIDVSCDNHAEAFIITQLRLRQNELIEETFGILFNRAHGRCEQSRRQAIPG